MSTIERIRDKVRRREYYLSSHADDEMMEDNLDRSDIENAILNGQIDKKLTADPRGTRYRVKGQAHDGRTIYIICRFKESGALIIITVYEKG